MPQPSQAAAGTAAMDTGDTGTGVPARTAVLAAGTFAVGTDAFVVAGVLPDIADSLRVSVAEAGQLMTVFGIAYAVLSPVLAALTDTWSRRRVLLTALIVFVLGNVATALAPLYGWVLVARVLAAAGAALFTPNAGATAAAIAPAAHRARAIAVVTLGLTSSTTLGAPIGTVLGAALSWRETMWFVAALGVIAALGIALWLPQVPAPPAVGLRRRLAPLGDRRVVTVLLATVAIFVGVYLIYIYSSVILGRATGGNGGMLAVLLFMHGCAGIVSTFLSGRWTDRIGARRVIAVVAVILVADYLLLPAVSATIVGAGIAIVVYGLGAWGVTVPQQHRMITLQPSAAALVVSLNASAIYVAVSLSGVIGAGALQVLPGTLLPWVAAVSVIVGLTASELAHRMTRNTDERRNPTTLTP